MKHKLTSNRVRLSDSNELLQKRYMTKSEHDMGRTWEYFHGRSEPSSSLIDLILLIVDVHIPQPHLMNNERYLASQSHMFHTEANTQQHPQAARALSGITNPALGGAFLSNSRTIAWSSMVTLFLRLHKPMRHPRLRLYCLTSSAVFFACCFPLFQYSTAKLNASCATFSSVLMPALTVLTRPSGPCVFLYSSWYAPNR